MQVGDERKQKISGIRWSELGWVGFKVIEADLTDEEFKAMPLIQRREYEDAKARWSRLDAEVVNG